MKKMIRLFIIALVGICFVSCASNERKAKKLAEEHIKSNLKVPESFSMVECSIDSVFAPFFTDKFMNMSIELYKLDKKENDIIDAINSLQGSLDRWAITPTTRNDRHAKELRDQIATAKSLHEEIKHEIYPRISKAVNYVSKTPKDFVGWRINVTFNSKTPVGEELQVKTFLFADKEFTKINCEYYSESEEQEAHQWLIENVVKW